MFSWLPADFGQTWLPNVVCTVGGIILSGLIGFWQGRRLTRESEKHTRMLTNLLVVMEERGHLKLVRDDKGEVTGGRAYEFKVEPAKLDLTVGSITPVITQGSVAVAPANDPT